MAANTAVTTAVTSDDVDAAADVTSYNAARSSALTAAATATTFATQSNANTVLAITAVNSAITTFNALAVQLNTDTAVPTSAYSVAEIYGALQQLKNSLTYLLSQQPTA